MRITAIYDYSRDIVIIKAKSGDSEDYLEVDVSPSTLELSDSEKEYRELQAHELFIIEVFNKVSESLFCALNDQTLHERLALIFKSEVSENEHSIDNAVKRALKSYQIVDIIKNYINRAL